MLKSRFWALKWVYLSKYGVSKSYLSLVRAFESFKCAGLVALSSPLRQLVVPSGVIDVLSKACTARQSD